MKWKNWLIFSLIALISAGVVFFFSFSEDRKAKLDKGEYREAFREQYKIFAVEIPDEVDFAGEEAPLDRFDVREGLDRELTVNTYWHSNTHLMFKRAFRYFPVIDSILKTKNVPEDFRYVAMIESGLQNVVSPAGAHGMWQIMKSTGRENGLEINDEVDERYRLAKATKVACDYLKKGKKRFGTWTLAAATYNMGRGSVARELKEQKVDNYYDLYLNKETARYIYRILAVKTIYENPTKYGFYFRKKDFYPPLKTKTVSVNSSEIDLVDFAREHDISYKILKLLNPWLRSDHLSNRNNKTYQIKLPKEDGLKYSEIMDHYRNNQDIFHDTLSVQQLR